MIVACIIIWIIALILITICSFCSDALDGFSGLMLGIITGCFIILGFASLIDCLEQNQPNAMDVYQGKTTLKYEVVDGVKVDSVVVWKDGK